MGSPEMGRRALFALGTAMAWRAGAARAQPGAEAYPSRPIRFVVPFAAGGNSDVTARLFASQITARLGQAVVVENRSGATGAIGTEAVVRSRPDGYTLLIGSPGSIVNGPLLMAAPRYDTMADLVPVALLGQAPMVIILRPGLPVRDLQQLVAFSRTQPRGVTIGTSGVGGANHLPLELFKAATGANLVHVPYRGGGNTLPDFVAGNVDGVLIEMSSVLDLHRDGRGRILGIAAAHRSKQVPEVATFIEQGIDGFVAASFVGLFAPAGTPEPVLGALQGAISAAAADPEVLARLEAIGNNPPTGAELTTPGTVAFLQGELAKARQAIAIAGLKPE
ncbi:Bug family tripartite tricarboxylate transporter substrate binding protein [Pararoseomonas indoligenes]|uniref:Tripartite tricarboxylate transporter substrate binding protein n=1 Tax=Roseomonas indoligenes TaxID=2820811 RepID=A0A940MY37_9PROT|nr:tripartite tricarboxylate transporter substrate binding protein [Pararoseomonas indoligenes]MBP0495514.1 tripartite tricarboxylate transporter substrate binding protein [Pararoseomonas indoligenes]